MADIEQRARELREAIGDYWKLAYAEGAEGRTSDTENGDAQETWHRIDSLIAALASQPQAQVPDGYVLVPREPTEAMIDAIESIKMPHAILRTGVRLADFRERYAAMLAAAPAPEVSAGAYPVPRSRKECAALARIILAHLSVIDAHIDAAIARIEHEE